MLLPLWSFAQVNLDSGLVAYWPFNGNADDESGNGLNGIVSGASLVSDRFGQADAAYFFDNVDDFIEVPNMGNQLSLTGQWSISFWIRPASAVGGQVSGAEDPILSKVATVGGNEDNYLILWNSQGNDDGITARLAVQIERSVDDQDFACGSDSLMVNMDYHGVVVFDTDHLKLFVNSEQVDSVFVGASFIPYMGPAPLRIGNAQHTTHFPVVFHGVIDDIRIYRRAITLEEINFLFAESPSSTDVSFISHPSISLSPNPAPGAFSLTSPTAAIQSIELYDLTGRRLPAEISHDRHEAQVRSRYRGLALVKVQTEQGMWVQKVRME